MPPIRVDVQHAVKRTEGDKRNSGTSATPVTLRSLAQELDDQLLAALAANLG